MEHQLLLHLPPATQKAHQQQQLLQQPAHGVSMAAAFRSAQLAGPRVSLQRYKLATQWSKGLQQFLGRGSAATSSSSSGRSGASAAPPHASQGDATSLSSAASQGASPPPQSPSSSSSSRSKTGPLLPQDRPIVALVTAAGPIMQGASGADPSGERGIDSHKLVRVLRNFRENPQASWGGLHPRVC